MKLLRRYCAAALCSLAIFTIQALFFPSLSLAQKRYALVVGNNTYRNLSADKQLLNAVNDAQRMRDTLRFLGFDVLYGENLDRNALINRLYDLTARIGKDDVVFVFFAGHGVSFSGANYLLPSDIPAPRASGRAEEGRIADQAIAETTVIERLTNAGARVAIFVIDACRDNPLQAADRRSVGQTRGLAESTKTLGVFSVYSAGIGQTALDRLGPDDREPNSLFTRVFVEKLRTPGLELRAVVNQTRRVVYDMARNVGHDQFPAYYDQIIGDDIILLPTDRPASPPPSLPMPSQPSIVLPTPNVRFPEQIDVVRSFYLALSVADGVKASSLVVPEKRSRGPFSADEITRFYSSLAEPLRLANVSSMGNSTYQASYTFRTNRSRFCDGTAIVTLTERSGQPLIETIKALRGC